MTLLNYVSLLLYLFKQLMIHLWHQVAVSLSCSNGILRELKVIQFVILFILKSHDMIIKITLNAQT